MSSMSANTVFLNNVEMYVRSMNGTALFSDIGQREKVPRDLAFLPVGSKQLRKLCRADPRFVLTADAALKISLVEGVNGGAAAVVPLPVAPATPIAQPISTSSSSTISTISTIGTISTNSPQHKKEVIGSYATGDFGRPPCLIVLTGLPGAGKSTFCSQLDPEIWTIVNHSLATFSAAGSGAAAAPEAQAFWFGQPAHPAA